MTSAELLIYNCFIMLLCSLDNNGVAGVFLIIWLFPLSPPPPPPVLSLLCSLSRTSGNCGENNDCLPACSVSHGFVHHKQCRCSHRASQSRRPGRLLYQLIVFTGPASLITDSDSSALVAVPPLSGFYAVSANVTFYTFLFR